VITSKQIFFDVAENSSFEIEDMEIEIDKDHVHILLKISPAFSVSSYVRRIKQSTTQSVRGKFKWLKKQFWNENTFWSDGCFVCSVGDAWTETIRKYIHEQGAFFRFIPATPLRVDHWVFSKIYDKSHEIELNEHQIH
jgi:putative transposase